MNFARAGNSHYEVNPHQSSDDFMSTSNCLLLFRLIRFYTVINFFLCLSSSNTRKIKEEFQIRLLPNLWISHITLTHTWGMLCFALSFISHKVQHKYRYVCIILVISRTIYYLISVTLLNRKYWYPSISSSSNVIYLIINWYTLKR